MNGVRTKNLITYNFVSGTVGQPVCPARPLTRACCWTIQDGSLWTSGFNIPTIPHFFVWVWPAPNCHP